jgi:hypothetical protein
MRLCLCAAFPIVLSIRLRCGSQSPLGERCTDSQRHLPPSLRMQPVLRTGAMALVGQLGLVQARAWGGHAASPLASEVDGLSSSASAQADQPAIRQMAGFPIAQTAFIPRLVTTWPAAYRETGAATARTPVLPGRSEAAARAWSHGTLIPADWYGHADSAPTGNVRGRMPTSAWSLCVQVVECRSSNADLKEVELWVDGERLGEQRPGPLVVAQALGDHPRVVVQRRVARAEPHRLSHGV